METNTYPLVDNLQKLLETASNDHADTFRKVLDILNEEVAHRGGEGQRPKARFDVAYAVFCEDASPVRQMIIVARIEHSLRLVAANIDINDVECCKHVDMQLVILLHENYQKIIGDDAYVAVVQKVFGDNFDLILTAAKRQLKDCIFEYFKDYPQYYESAKVYFDAMHTMFLDRHPGPLFRSVIEDTFNEVAKRGFDSIPRSRN